MEIHEHRSLLLGGFYWKDSPRILRDILCLSMSAAEPLVIGPRHWPQTWRRALQNRLAPMRRSPRGLRLAIPIQLMLFPVAVPLFFEGLDLGGSRTRIPP